MLTRRHFLAATAGALGAAALGDGFLLEPAAVQITRHELPIPSLPAALDGVRIACLADVHLHRGISRAAHAALEQVDRERPEIVVLAG
ncbi:MAG: twin-arginine translocation signal domain-containing protein, partial [Candidatus Eisenbacteria bacterium]